MSDSKNKKINLWLDESEVNQIVSLLGDNAAELKEKILGQQRESPKFVEEAMEHRQVAALVCMDLDVLNDIAEDGGDSQTVESLRKQITYFHQLKEKLISDPRERETRYNAANMLFGLNR